MSNARCACGALRLMPKEPPQLTAPGLPVLFDSGTRPGSDVKALMLGTTAIGIGRPYALGAALVGTDGIVHVLRMIFAEADLPMALDGYPAIVGYGPRLC